jgi:hypothetical protein
MITEEYQMECLQRFLNTLERIAVVLEGNCAHVCGYPDNPCYECELRDEKEARTKV